MKKTFTSITILVFGAHGGKIISGATSAVSRQYRTAIARVQPELRQPKRQQT